MRTRRVLCAAALLGAMALSIAACGGLPEFGHATACGLPSKTVAAAVGTEEFKTVTRGATSLPLHPTVRSALGFQCDVSLADRGDVLSVHVAVASPPHLAAVRTSIRSADHTFELGRGRAGLKASSYGSFYGWWLCGTMTAAVSGSRNPTTIQRLALLHALAQAAGCSHVGSASKK